MLPKQELPAFATPAQQTKIIHEIAALLTGRGWLLASAESCTGGLVAAACTDVAGSSLWFERGLVCYSNAAKTELLGVGETLLRDHGAVSQPVALAMADGALRRAPVQRSVAVTGIAGPGGAVLGKPVGTVWLALGQRDDTGHIQLSAQRLQLAGDRSAVRQATLVAALTALRRSLP